MRSTFAASGPSESTGIFPSRIFQLNRELSASSAFQSPLVIHLVSIEKITKKFTPSLHFFLHKINSVFKSTQLNHKLARQGILQTETNLQRTDCRSTTPECASPWRTPSRAAPTRWTCCSRAWKRRRCSSATSEGPSPRSSGSGLRTTLSTGRAPSHCKVAWN